MPHNPDFIEDLYDFQRKFGLFYLGPPRDLPKAQHELRNKRLREEYYEWHEASDCNEDEHELDALVDLVYVAIGNALMKGWDFGEAWRRVHKANMTKKLSDNKIDVIKPEGFVHPSLADLVEMEE